MLGLPCFARTARDDLAPAYYNGSRSDPCARTLKTGSLTAHHFGWSLSAPLALPTIVGVAGAIYFYGALMSGLLLLTIALRFSRERELDDARRLLKATVIYLPVLLLLIILDARW
jgi:heme O synthase-like polyprenyltransferase